MKPTSRPHLVETPGYSNVALPGLQDDFFGGVGVVVCRLRPPQPRHRPSRRAQGHAGHPDLDRHPAGRPPAGLRLQGGGDAGDRRDAAGGRPVRARLFDDAAHLSVAHHAADRRAAGRARRARQRRLQARRGQGRARRDALPAGDPQEGGVCHRRRRLGLRAPGEDGPLDRLRLLRGRHRVPLRHRPRRPPAAGGRDAQALAGLAALGRRTSRSSSSFTSTSRTRPTRLPSPTPRAMRRNTTARSPPPITSWAS